jgi:flagellar hook assembly protein FlgD
VRPVNVSLRVSTAATVRVQVRRTNGKLVWSKVMKVKKAGASSVRWNLRDSKGHKVKKGSYRFTITVTDASGAKVVINKSVRVR